MLKFTRKLIFTLLLFSLSACISFKKPHDSSEPLDIVSRNQNLDTQNNIVRLPGEPPVYKIGDQVSITALRDCKFEKRTSLSGLSRQALIGLTKLDFQEQSTIQIEGHEFVFNKLEANESPRLRFALFSGIIDDCLVDYVLWAESHLPDKQFEEAKNILIGLIERTVRE